MTCESFEDDCKSTCCEDFDADGDALLPRIVNFASLSHIDGNSEYTSSLVIPTDACMPAEKRRLPAPKSRSRLKRKKANMDCQVKLEKLPESLVQSAKTGNIFVNPDKSRRVDTTVVIEDQPMKTEPPEEYTPEESTMIQATVSHPTNRQNSATVTPLVRSALSKNLSNKPLHPHSDHPYVSQTVPTATEATPPAATSTASDAQNASTRSDGVEQDISVILLKCAQLPKTSTPGAENKNVTDPRDVTRIVLNMLQRQNIKQPVGKGGGGVSVLLNNNARQQKMSGGSSHGAEDEAKLKKELEISNKAKAALATKLKEEQTKVRYLLAQVISLKDTVKQLSKNSTGTHAEGTSGGNSSSDCRSEM